MLIGEAFIMTTIAVFVGCFLYFQWAYYEGFYTLDDGVPGIWRPLPDQSFLCTFLHRITAGICGDDGGDMAWCIHSSAQYQPYIAGRSVTG